ncbi:UDP-N-acetylglucosamine--N-acetylmuramyl-(pentapeptide) pyrophosphoryl-undecaprenol N-acetylglucosamine transferase [Fimbriimonas ginsengisoli]|uniref:UDP-N-acetylglucosamine--N-acetylmuramyl-(pentapeptide) pyrophosphoryl-undecaprenol N-acetylglucosamine transferase n=1 Tax=Fimbriimonas ginsengisoli Gsoil 348 TaxID=661478 RepID=A0A068NZ89_FIMGI|nr:glycosyltransferase [Fimbriimonas ginsengisoli]AIE88154.1 UDP-diphospho-muramoylpentapeptide beta-N- acetylglucosaminyltransferase [Fimbriimonas ginsengisoli Gsoil 348]
MRLVVTGGGTGGHIYPALEVARLASERGTEIRYLGSLRGQESAACAARGISFLGFPSEPLWSLKTFGGWRALLALQRSRGMARRALRADRPDVVFSTGGFSAGPVVAAARDLGIPYIVHSADSVPPRSSAMFARQAFAFTTVFRSTEKFFTERPVTRTGQPIRDELRSAAATERPEGEPTVLVIGGSQGAEFLNTYVPLAAATGRFQARVIHATGPKHLEVTLDRIRKAGLGETYQAVPYLEAPALIQAMRSATVVVARAGGTLAELALFGLPTVLVPLPTSANDHQLHNAREFQAMEAATVLWQPDERRHPAPEARPEAIAEAIAGWLSDAPRREAARHNLKEWDVPDATARIVSLIEQAAQSRNA